MDSGQLTVLLLLYTYTEIRAVWQYNYELGVYTSGMHYSGSFASCGPWPFDLLFSNDSRRTQKELKGRRNYKKKKQLLLLAKSFVCVSFLVGRSFAVWYVHKWSISLRPRSHPKNGRATTHTHTHIERKSITKSIYRSSFTQQTNGVYLWMYRWTLSLSLTRFFLFSFCVFGPLNFWRDDGESLRRCTTTTFSWLCPSQLALYTHQHHSLSFLILISMFYPLMKNPDQLLTRDSQHNPRPIRLLHLLLQNLLIETSIIHQWCELTQIGEKQLNNPTTFVSFFLSFPHVGAVVIRSDGMAINF